MGYVDYLKWLGDRPNSFSSYCEWLGTFMGDPPF